MASADKFHNPAFVEALISQDRSIAEAVREFTLPVNIAVNYSDEALETSLWEAWHDLVMIARQTPHDKQEKLAKFVDTVQKQAGGPVKEGGEKGKVWGQEVEWRSLPLLGPEIRECWNTAPKDQGREETDEGWVNLNAFIARITAFSHPGDSMDFSLYAIWTLRSALENSDVKDTLPSKSDLQAAAMWIIYTSSELQDRARVNQSFDGEMAREGQDLIGKGWTGLSMERWGIWTERLLQTRDKCRDGRTNELLTMAISYQ